MRLTETQLRRIVREEILRESLYDSWHDGSYSATGTPDPQRVWDKWVELGGIQGKKVFSYDLARELDLDDPSEIDYTGSGLMMRNGVVEEMTSPMSESRLLEASMTAVYQGKTYKASPGVIALLKKYNWDGAKAIADGKFEWAKKRGLNPWSLIQAATIVGTGRPIQRKKAAEVV